jgi:transposase-like protein
MGRRGYPPEFRRKVLDLVEAERPIAEIAQALGISEQSTTPGGAKTASTAVLSLA